VDVGESGQASSDKISLIRRSAEDRVCEGSGNQVPARIYRNTVMGFSEMRFESG
jgi:hypothetical protein